MLANSQTARDTLSGHPLVDNMAPTIHPFHSVQPHQFATQLPASSSQPSSAVEELEVCSTLSPGICEHNNVPLPPVSSTVAVSVSTQTPNQSSMKPGEIIDVVDEDPISRKRKRYAGFWDEVVENIELFIHAPSESESPIFLTRVTPCIRRRRKSSVSRKPRAANLPRKSKKIVHEIKSEGDVEDRSRKRSKCSTKPIVVPEDQTKIELDEGFFAA